MDGPNIDEIIQPIEPKDEAFVQIQDGVTFAPYRHICGCSRSPNILGLIFNIIMWLAFLFMLFNVLYCAGVIPLNQNSFFISLAYVYSSLALPFWFIFYVVLYLVYLIDVFCTNSCKYLHHMDLVEDFVTFVDRMRNVRPYVGFWCECFHYETRERRVHYRDSDGRRRTQTESHREKVVTHSEAEEFDYSKFEDISGNVTQEILAFIATKVKFSKTWSHGDERTKKLYEKQLANFIERNKDRDNHFHSSNVFNVEGFEERKLCLVELGRKSAVMSYGFYLLFSLLLLGSWPYRYWLETMTVRARFQFHKKIYA